MFLRFIRINSSRSISIQVEEEKHIIYECFEKTQKDILVPTDHSLYKKQRKNTQKTSTLTQNRKRNKKEKIFGVWADGEKNQAELHKKGNQQRENVYQSLQAVLRDLEILPSTMLTKCQAM